MSDSASKKTAVDDVVQLSLFPAIASLSYVFWVVGGMEMIERLAYYGVKAVATLYAKDPVSKGGLGVSMTEFGTILTCWAMIQSVLPVFTGGLSDRFGYKRTIAASTVIKICGYLIMAAFPTFYGFFAGAVVLAAGTAVFKPGIQGTLVKSTRRENSSMAWGIFYQTVNIGGFLGPLVAGFLRKMEWQYVFLACAAIISLNFFMLMLYTEPGQETREADLAAKDAAAGGKPSVGGALSALATDSLRELGKPHVWVYLLIFSGFWFMFNSLFDVLPAHIEDWVDTRDIVSTLFGTGGAQNEIVKFFIVMNKDGTEVLPEGMLNLNAGLIMLTCFLFAAVSGKMRAITSMVVGTLLAAAAMFASGASALGWISVAAIGVFSVGEMLSSPKFSEYIGNFAPSDKKGMYLGFSQVSLAIGWTLEGQIAPRMYDAFSSKEVFSRQMLVEKGMTPEAVAAIPRGEGFTKLVELLNQPPHEVTTMLYNLHHPGTMWIFMGGIGVLSAAGIWWYGTWVPGAMLRAEQKAAARG